jgi:hypothetical protein
LYLKFALFESSESTFLRRKKGRSRNSNIVQGQKTRARSRQPCHLHCKDPMRTLIELADTRCDSVLALLLIYLYLFFYVLTAVDYVYSESIFNTISNAAEKTYRFSVFVLSTYLQIEILPVEKRCKDMLERHRMLLRDQKGGKGRITIVAVYKKVTI